jgi:hypothetical protein
MAAEISHISGIVVSCHKALKAQRFTKMFCVPSWFCDLMAEWP